MPLSLSAGISQERIVAEMARMGFANDDNGDLVFSFYS
jgi:hypothetical protein